MKAADGSQSLSNGKHPRTPPNTDDERRLCAILSSGFLIQLDLSVTLLEVLTLGRSLWEQDQSATGEAHSQSDSFGGC